MPLEPESVYFQLGHLVATIPDLAANGDIQPETHRWLGRAYALVNEFDRGSEAINLKMQVDFLASGLDRRGAAQKIQAILFRILAVAELRAPAAARGAFIPAGNAFDAMAAVGSVLNRATSDILIVDPYMDEKALTDFAVLVGIELRLLADERDHKPSFRPAVKRWISQYGRERPVQARLASARSLHDRLIAVDGQTTWV
ncbi:hypothetical protein [Methylocystis rosea]|uniref:hypothetical protein n=1 Tax=Methylocystis rosea TaxID=173366 RepID=UPI00037FC0A9|nr:hypothetical protein [Methylocystis rosea]